MMDIFERARNLKKNIIKGNNERLNKLDAKREKEIKVLKGKNLVSEKRSRIKTEYKEAKKKAFKSSLLGKGLTQIKKNQAKAKKKGTGKTASQKANDYMNRKPPSWL